MSVRTLVIIAGIAISAVLCLVAGALVLMGSPTEVTALRVLFVSTLVYNTGYISGFLHGKGLSDDGKKTTPRTL